LLLYKVFSKLPVSWHTPSHCSREGRPLCGATHRRTRTYGSLLQSSIIFHFSEINFFNNRSVPFIYSTWLKSGFFCCLIYVISFIIYTLMWVFLCATKFFRYCLFEAFHNSHYENVTRFQKFTLKMIFSFLLFKKIIRLIAIMWEHKNSVSKI